MRIMIALIKREYLEHRGAFLYAPSVLLSIVTTVLLFGVLAGDSDLSGEDIAVLSGSTFFQIGMAGVFVAWFVYLTIALFFYYADSFSADRRNNSLLFWKSLPQSDLKVLTSKALSGITIFTAIILGFALVTSVLLYVLFALFTFRHGGIEAPSLFEAAGIFVQMGLAGSVYFVLSLLMLAPALAWVAGLSTLFRRWSIPLAFLIPGTIVLLEYINSVIGFGGGRPFANLLGNWFNSDFDEDKAVEIVMNSSGNVPLGLFKLLLSNVDWVNMGIGLGLTVGVVYLASEYRRRKIHA